MITMRTRAEKRTFNWTANRYLLIRPQLAGTEISSTRSKLTDEEDRVDSKEVIKKKMKQDELNDSKWSYKQGKILKFLFVLLVALLHSIHISKIQNQRSKVISLKTINP